VLACIRQVATPILKLRPVVAIGNKRQDQNAAFARILRPHHRPSSPSCRRGFLASMKFLLSPEHGNRGFVADADQFGIRGKTSHKSSPATVRGGRND